LTFGNITSSFRLMLCEVFSDSFFSSADGFESTLEQPNKKHIDNRAKHTNKDEYIDINFFTINTPYFIVLASYIASSNSIEI